MICARTVLSGADLPPEHLTKTLLYLDKASTASDRGPVVEEVTASDHGPVVEKVTASRSSGQWLENSTILLQKTRGFNLIESLETISTVFLILRLVQFYETR